MGRTVSGVTRTLEQAVFDQELSARDGFLQRGDPRAKAVGALVLLIVAGLARHVETALLMCAGTAVLAWLSRIPVDTFARRAWLGIPLFAAVVAAPSLFMVPGNAVLGPLRLPFLSLAITDNGLAGAALFISRVGASVSVAVLLVSTTRWADLLRALRVLGVPESMVVVLGMTYRYLFLLLHSANNLFLARASRVVGVTSGAEQRRWAAGAAGVLMERSMRMSTDVLGAMRARGFSGEVRTAPDSRMRDGDWLMLALGVAAAAGLLLIDGGLGSL